MSRAPSKPRAQKASAGIADAPMRMPCKRSPKRAVAVATGVADAAPVKPRKVTPKQLREAHRDLHEAIDRVEKPAMKTWEETHFPYDGPDYVVENARKRRAAMDMWVTIVTVFGVIVIIGLMAWWVG